MPRVVAVARSRRGGRLDCGHRARPGELIHKIDTGDRGRQTVHGNGQGEWWCTRCASPVPAA
jgi:hypothetical protein